MYVFVLLPRAGITITFVLPHETHSFRRTLTPRLFLHSPHSIPIIDEQVFGLPKGNVIHLPFLSHTHCLSGSEFTYTFAHELIPILVLKKQRQYPEGHKWKNKPTESSSTCIAQ